MEHSQGDPGLPIAVINGQPVSALVNMGVNILCINYTAERNVQFDIIMNSSTVAHEVWSSTETLGWVCYNLTTRNIKRNVHVLVLRGIKSQSLLGLENASYLKLKIPLPTAELAQRQISVLHPHVAWPITKLQGWAQIVNYSSRSGTRKVSLKRLLEENDAILSNSETHCTYFHWKTFGMPLERCSHPSDILQVVTNLWS